MITSLKAHLRRRVRKFLEIDSEKRLLERRLSNLEESHYESIGVLRPPSSMIFVGNGDFTKVGEGHLQLFRDLCDLQPDERVLDVGCGIGRMAIPLAGYLNETGEYKGFDIVKEGIDWCNENIKRRFPNFDFLWVDVYSKRYNPNGKTLAKDFRFPYNGESFDFVFLVSVFTHMLPEDVKNYLREISRVMASGSRCFISWHLLNDNSLKCIAAGKSAARFKHKLGANTRVNKKEMPEAGVAYEEQFVRRLYQQHGLDIREIFYGSWACGEGFHLQDIVIAFKSDR